MFIGLALESVDGEGISEGISETGLGQLGWDWLDSLDKTGQLGWDRSGSLDKVLCVTHRSARKDRFGYFLE